MEARSIEPVVAEDDIVLPFSTDRSRVLGRLIRLGPLVDGILSRHAYPPGVCEVLGQALALTGMLGSTLKFDGNLILQSRSDGPIGMMVVNFEAPGKLRAYAGFDRERLDELAPVGPAGHGRLIGRGHLALTIDPGANMDRYQGIVALEGDDLSAAANTYFRQSEQLPTFVRLAVARHRSHDEPDGQWRWRAGGIMVQYVSPVGGYVRPEDEEADGRQRWLLGEQEDDWQRVSMLAATVEDHELLDPTLAPTRLLYRLFHEEGVRASQPLNLETFCRCSRDRVATFLETFRDDDIEELLDDEGKITVTCEFCSESYRFDPA